MRISLWQQFSSNHSADYVIVGVFESVELAKKSGIKIQQSVADIAAWSDQSKGDRWLLSPVEAYLASEYHFDWKQVVDWLHPFPRFFRPPYQREPQDHITQFDRVVFIDAPGGSSTWQTGHQFVHLMEAMGAKVYSDVYMGEDPDDGHDVFKSIDIEIQCIAPSVDTAISIQRQLEIQKLHPIPWITFHPRYSALMSPLSPNDWKNVEHIWLRDQRLWREFIDANQSIDPDWQNKRSNYITQHEHVEGIIWSLRNDTELTSVNCSRDEQNLEVKVESVGYRIDTLLPALVEWMRSQGCVVDYKLRQTGET